MELSKQSLFSFDSRSIKFVITLRGVSLVSPDGISILSRIALEVAEGAWVAIIGASGCGKSTIFEMLIAYCSASAGRVLMNAELVDQRRIPLALGYVPQHAFDT